jgi:hypothetical protein
VPWEERYFTKTDGGHVFFPYGALSFRRGYIVDDAKKAELIALLKRLNRSSLPLMLIAAVAGWWIAGADGLWLGLGLNPRDCAPYLTARAKSPTPSKK